MIEIQDIDLKELIQRETNDRFDRRGYINCPFHKDKTPSLSVKFNSNKNKDFFKCFGCDTKGDAIDFIMQHKGLDYLAAREYLGLENKKTDREVEIDKVKGYIQWQIDKTDFRKGQELIGLFPFTDKDNNVIYYKAKFLKSDGKKDISYYHIEGDKVINKRGCEEVPYNLFNAIQGMKRGKIIIFVEGEKDVNTINSIFRNTDFVATSIKGCKDFEVLKRDNIRVYVITDTGEAGEQYKWHIYKELKDVSEEFKFITLPGLRALGNNKDVTDWIEAGKTKIDLLRAFDRSLDFKSKYDLQQDNRGIFKYFYDKKDECYRKNYLTDFRLLEATRMRFVDNDQEGIKLILKSSTGSILEKVGPSTCFDDVRAFKNFLGTIDLAFKGKADDVTDLKSWINKYFALENEEFYQGIKFINRDGSLNLITNEGTITPKGIDAGAKSEKMSDIEIISKEFITKEELKKLRQKIFKFNTPDKTTVIIGTVINNLAVYQNQESKEKLHHLLVVGESGSGKTTILTNVIAPILNYPIKDIKSIGLITGFAMIKDLSTGNYPILFDEFKPSALDKYKIQKISESLRNLYDRTTISRGDKSFKVKDFQLTRPIILAGEESYPNQEKALIERSAIVYLSKRERTEEHTEAMKWLIENEKLLNKFGRSLIDAILNLTSDEYKKIRERVKSKFGLKNRVLSTAVNIATGIEIFNILLEKHSLQKLKDYEKFISKNINEEILEDSEDTKSTVEQMLVLYNSMIEDGRALDAKEIVQRKGDGLFIRTSEMINQIHMFCNQVGSAEVVPLKLKDFKKQASKAGYIMKTASKLIRIGDKPIRFDEYSRERIRTLRLDSIIEPELSEVTDEESKVIDGVFNFR